MKISTIQSVKIIDYKVHSGVNGNLFPVDLESTLPFKAKRAFFVYNVSDSKSKRGCHAHKITEQVLFCLSGEVKVTCKDSNETKTFVLNSPNKGLYIPNMIWDEITYKDENSVLFVFSSTKYDRTDYIEDWSEFSKIIEAQNEY